MTKMFTISGQVSEQVSEQLSEQVSKQVSTKITNIVSLFYTDTENSHLISTVHTDDNGFFRFEFDFDKQTNHIFYITAFQNTHIKLACVLGNKLSNEFVIINEITTIAALYCFNNFYRDGQIYGNYKGVNTAALMYFNFVKKNGTLSDVITSSPNGYETNSMMLLNTLGNLIAICIKSQDMFNNVAFFTKYDNYIPQDIFEIIISIVRQPANNVKTIFEASFAEKIYKPYLPFSSLPDALTLAVKVNDSGSINVMIGGTGNIIFDDDGNAWITHNVVQGTPNSSNCSIVLLPNGKPAPISPVFGGGVFGGGYGIIKYFDNIIVGNNGWGNEVSDGGLAIYKTDGTPLTGADGYKKDFFRVQGICVDKKNNIWIMSYGNSSIVVLVNGSLENKLIYKLPNNSEPFDVVIDSKGDGIISTNGKTTLIKLRLIDFDSGFEVIYNISAGPKLLGLSIDSNDNVFAASPENSSIYKVDANGQIVMAITDNGIYTPWGCTVDGNNNVWIANFGANPETNLYAIPYFTNDGVPISPPTGYTLPSGGSQVLLNNGIPLYGFGSGPSYNPLMKQTAIKIDCAGNLWVTNNFKPSTPEITDNPGGDGIVIFVGIGKY